MTELWLVLKMNGTDSACAVPNKSHSLGLCLSSQIFLYGFSLIGENHRNFWIGKNFKVPLVPTTLGSVTFHKTKLLKAPSILKVYD